jgi:diacylglycerol O-acyltransferase
MKRPPASPSPLLRRRALGRRLDTVEVSRDELRAAARAAGCSSNDAYLAAICGALRRYHEALGVPVDAIPLAMPVSRRTAADPPGGNRFSAVRLAAPLSVHDPVERMRRIHEIVRTALDEPAINALAALMPVLSRLPSSVLDKLASTAGGTDVQASNVAGYPEAPYVAGVKIVKSYWFGPLSGVAIMTVLLSQAGICSVGVHYDTASVADGDLFARCLREGFDEVLSVAPKQPPAMAQGG